MIRSLHVVLVVHSLNHNNIGRVYPFLEAFTDVPDIHVTLVGWDQTGRLFPLLEQSRQPIVRLRGPMTGPAAQAALASAVQGCDVIHCFKNQPHLRTAVAVARRQHVPLVLDLDDWELGLFLEGVAGWPRWRQVLMGSRVVGRIGDALTLEHLARVAPAELVVNSHALQALFGGAIVYTAADAAAFDPARSDRATFREAHGMNPSALVIGFPGTPHPHKGIDDLLTAFAAINRLRPDVRLLFVGVPGHNPYRQRLSRTPGVILVDYVPAEAYADAYAACDVIVIPQLAVNEGIVQTPAKLILAMASGRPIIAASVGDIPTILGSAGVLVPPGDAVALEAAMVEALDDPRLRERLGASARERFLEHFTLDHLRDQMTTIYTRAVEGVSSPHRVSHQPHVQQ